MLRALDAVKDSLRSHNKAMDCLVSQFEEDEFSQFLMLASLEILYDTYARHGKIVLCGIGKSFKIANKIVATLNSLSILSVPLHPSEALHGDLGMIQERDAVILVTASGNTPEILQILPHISKNVPIILLTCNRNSKLSNHPQVSSLLLVDLPEQFSDESVHGIPAPTVSTSLSLILADATVLALLEMIENDVNKRKRLFSIKHPGGSIGAKLSHLNTNTLDSAAGSGTKRSFSSQVSYSSLLSLRQIRDTFGNPDSKLVSASSSMVSSDDEDLEFPHRSKINLDLSYEISSLESSKLKMIDEQTLNTLTENSLLKWSIAFEYILFKIGKNVYAMSSHDIQKALKDAYSKSCDFDEETWGKFIKTLRLGFNEIAYLPQ